MLAYDIIFNIQTISFFVQNDYFMPQLYRLYIIFVYHPWAL